MLVVYMVKLRKGLERVFLNDAKYFVYVVRCRTQDHYYIGQTNNLHQRLVCQHEWGKGAKFTRIHGVEEVIYLEPCKTRKQALRRENEITLEYMLEHGIDNVAGGDYPQANKNFVREELVSVLKNYRSKRKVVRA